jgi:hypothetical protein
MATFMFDPAKLAMNWVSASGARMRRVESLEAEGDAAWPTDALEESVTRCVRGVGGSSR